MTQAQDAPQQGGIIPELDGLRAIAIGLVMLYHFWAYAGASLVGNAVGAVAHVGWAGVDVFFALSGFLITGILARDRGHPQYYRRFYVRRALRIFPLYYAVIALIVAHGLIRSSWGVGPSDPSLAVLHRVWVNVVYGTNFAVAHFGAWDHVPMDIAWSLAIEEQFYLVFPFVVMLVRPDRLWRVLTWTVAGTIVLRVGVQIAAGDNYIQAYVLPFCRTDSLALGGLGALLLRAGPQRLVRAVAHTALPLWAAAIAVTLAVPRQHLLFATVGYTLLAAATTATIVALVTGRQRRLAALLRSRPMVAVGRVSYGLYLLHLVARAAIDPLLVEAGLAGGAPSVGLSMARAAILTAGALALAGLSWRLLERPILGLKGRLAPALEPRALTVSQTKD